MERKMRVVRKAKEETAKGFKFALRLSNPANESVVLFFDSEKELEGYKIQDDVVVKIESPQTKLA
jgi:hypothetical protein